MSETVARTGTQHGLTESTFARPGTPVFNGPEGVRFDFNYGCRVQVPVDGWRVRMIDIDTHNVVFDEAVEAGATVASRRKYFVRTRLQVFDGARLVFEHAFDAAGQPVLVRLASPALGDSLAWMPVIDAFREQHRCELRVALPVALHPLFRAGYPELELVSDCDTDAIGASGAPYYATYHVGLFSPYDERDHQPTDPRVSSMQDAVAYMLGVPPGERRPRMIVADTLRRIAQPYVCIATQATAQCKYWNNPRGWPTLIAHLKQRGFRVLCIDRDREYGLPGALNRMPADAEDFTGERPLQERASLLAHAAFFVGLGSGLSWLAWAVGTPVVMISGFSHPKTEFHTPWRVINFHPCNSCFNDTAHQFDPDDFNWCPRRAGNGMQRFQCTTAIGPEFVIETVDRLIDAHGFA
ncbi:autotransporter strand-loop-strand O-heptosyltransferase [Paraburkholderia rhizosphaerae]|uniref:Autotransporter strand-loop-strand O-heptosyltransferase n=1 Tax=Paraburkholderia rhizosphaerae TaxID=480658 RepID=A0A4R8LE39_9BURK|nr:autotransporter strand-loop-strand O-heptosyltransferase [Paraburkholderia rhizosphaerae]TDY40380.1 autotransporter strand-loop-strand O-heptosyltransferase [Paraburkholderia rhizosphaerae]